MEIKGDYLFYHCNDSDKSWISNYKITQTIISWLNFNGHINMEIPSILQLQETLVYLGEERTTLLNSRKPINLEHIGVIISFNLDLEIDILKFKSYDDFEKNMEILHRHLDLFGSPLVIEIENKKDKVFLTENSFYTCFTLNVESKKLGLLDHTYSDNDSVLNLYKSKKIRYGGIKETLLDGRDEFCYINVLLIKPQPGL